MRLDPKAPLLFMLNGRIVLWLFISAWIALVFGPGSRDTEPHPGIQWVQISAMLLHIVPFLLLLLAADWLTCWLRARSYRIELGDRGIALEMGVLVKSHETLLYSKIQDILIERGVVARLLGLSKVVIQNAMGRPESIMGLGADDAIELREKILERVPR